jgi:hypothetical protein
MTTASRHRLEFYLHDWTNTGIEHLKGGSDATGWVIYIQDGIVTIYNPWETGAHPSDPIAVDLRSISPQAVYFRLQRQYQTNTDSYEAWDIHGNRFFFITVTYTGDSPSGTGFIWGDGSNGAPMWAGWVRTHSTILPINSRPPTTVDNPNRLIEWKFDGSLADSGPNGYTATWSSGSPTYEATPYQNVVAVLRTSNANTWANTLSQRAGYAATLDGTGSYSQSDTSNAVTCFWQELSGPTLALFDSHTSCNPNLTGQIFGDYLLQMEAVDDRSITALASNHIGWVATDDNSVVVQPTSVANADALYGPMPAWGTSPWGYYDYFHNRGMTLRTIDYALPINPFFGFPVPMTYPGWSSLQWEQYGSGTVSWFWNGIGTGLGNQSVTPKGTTLAGNLGNNPVTDLTISVVDATQLDLSEFPTRILLYTGSGDPEEVRICSSSGNTLNVCYDGRGPNIQSWTSGQIVAQDKVTGTGTHFVTDSNSAICPVGVPSPPGPSFFSTGTITLTHSSTTATLSSDAHWYGFTSAQFNPAGKNDFYLRAAATHGGTPFYFITRMNTGGAEAEASNIIGGVIQPGGVVPIAGDTYGQNYYAGFVDVVVTDPTGSGADITANVTSGNIVTYTVNNGGSNYTSPTVWIYPRKVLLSRPFPSDADDGSYSYTLLPGTRTVTLFSPTYPDTTGKGLAMWGTSGCESETSLYLNPLSPAQINSLNNAFGYDSPHNGQLISGLQYSVTDTSGWINNGGLGGEFFYGENMASEVLYLRSGLDAAKSASSIVSDHILQSPWMYIVSSNLLSLGGPAIGAVNRLITQNNPSDPRWPLARQMFNRGAQEIEYMTTYGCNSDDTRDLGYGQALLVLGMLYDPDPTWKAHWQTYLTDMEAIDTSCHGSDNSWSNGGIWNSVGGCGAGGTNPCAPLTMTDGSAVVTPYGSLTSIASGMCMGTAYGSGTVTNGSASFSITSTTAGTLGAANDFVLNGTQSGGSQPLTLALQFNGSGPYNLAAYWPGDSGTVTWMSYTGGQANGWNQMAFAHCAGYPGLCGGSGQGNNDKVNLSRNYMCYQQDATHIILDRPWKEPGCTGGIVCGNDYASYGAGNVVGFGQLPYMLGIKSYAMGLLARSSLSPYNSDYQTFLDGATQWIHDNGINANDQTVPYGQTYQFCATSWLVLPNLSTLFDYKTDGCTAGASHFGVGGNREQIGELSNAISDFYLSNQSPTNKTWADTVTGALWGNPLFNTGGVYYDSNSSAADPAAFNMNDGAINEGKWYGFFTGMSFAHRWIAQRLENPAPAAPATRTIKVPFTCSGITGCAKAKMTVTQPTGDSASYTCTSSPCSLTSLAGIGSALLQIQYLTSGNAVLTTGDPLPLYVGR